MKAQYGFINISIIDKEVHANDVPIIPKRFCYHDYDKGKWLLT